MLGDLKIKILSLLFIGLSTVSCLTDFEDINTNSLEASSEDLEKDGLRSGGFFPQLQRGVIPIGSQGTAEVNKYQVGVNLMGDAWAGYMAPTTNKFFGGRNFTTYSFPEGWKSYVFSNMLNDIYNPWVSIKGNTIENPAAFALAQIIKIAGLQRATDVFGPIPYSEAGVEGALNAPYDSQEDVYLHCFEDLTQSIATLTEYAAGNPWLLPKYDVVYAGDVEKWIQFANSLMLRMAVRVSYAAPAMAQQYAELAMVHPKGVITGIDGIAQLKSNSDFRFMHPLKTIWDAYNDTRMGATISSYLKGYNDPRLAIYFKEGIIEEVSAYNAVRTGISQVNYYMDKAEISIPNFEDESPLYWMKASEVYFLRAEGAMRGWNMNGSVQELYNEGIRISFSENDADGAEIYIENETAVPADYVDPKGHINLNAAAPSDITVKWMESDTEERKLERIITQKYLAIYPDGQEAWSEWRRTGYPKQFPILDNQSSGVIPTELGVRRLPYPEKEYQQNREHVEKAVEYLRGEDTGATRLWWDKK